MYLITASLLNSWNWFLKYRNIEKFELTLSRKPTPTNPYINRGFTFEKWCEENLEETKGGEFQVTRYKEIGNYLLYGRLDCLKSDTIYDYKYSSHYIKGKFQYNYQTAMYLELVPEALKMVYVATNKNKDFNKDDIFYEEYYKNDTEPILNTIEIFMQWIKQNGYMEYMNQKWIARTDV